MSDERISLKPMPTEEWAALPKREQQLSFIADVIAYWLKFIGADGRDPDTHVILPGPNAPPFWPSIGQLTLWLKILRDSDGSGEAGETGTGSTEGDSAGPKDIAQ